MMQEQYSNWLWFCYNDGIQIFEDGSMYERQFLTLLETADWTGVTTGTVT
jgi:hypothetical protein